MSKKKNIGRNDPCPCGSGKKFKKCCQNKYLGPRKVKSVLDTSSRSASKIAGSLFSVPQPKPEAIEGSVENEKVEGKGNDTKDSSDQ